MSVVVKDYWRLSWLGVVLVLSILSTVNCRGSLRDSGEGASFRRVVVRLDWWFSNIGSGVRAVLCITLLKGALAWVLTWPVPP